MIKLALLWLALFLSAAFFFNRPSVAQDALLRFAVIGDYGSGNEHEADVAAMVSSWNPAFILTTGDNNYPEGEASTIDENIGQFYSAFIGNYAGTYGDGSPVNRFFPAMGNHDWLATDAQPYLDYFTLPGIERYYDFVEGSVHFFIVDSDNDEPDGSEADSIQAEWLRNGLSNSTAQWQIVVFHHPPYSSSAEHSATERMRWPFQEWGADIVLSGHSHHYERLLVNGLTYMVNGSGGAKLYGFADAVPESLVRYDSDYGAQLVSVYDCGMVFDFYSVSNGGTLIDSYALGTCEAQPFPTPTLTPSPTSLPPSGTITLYPNADTYVKSDSPSNNYGDNSSLRIDASPPVLSYLRFEVPSLPTPILSASLRIYANSANSTGFTVQLSSGDWEEDELRYENAPAPTGNYGVSEAIAATSWIEVDVSSLVSSGAVLNLVLSSTSNTATSFSSREGEFTPELVIVYGN